MFFALNFQPLRSWHKRFSHSQLFEQPSPHQHLSTAEGMRLRKHRLSVIQSQQKVQRNYFLERRTWL